MRVKSEVDVDTSFRTRAEPELPAEVAAQAVVPTAYQSGFETAPPPAQNAVDAQAAVEAQLAAARAAAPVAEPAPVAVATTAVPERRELTPAEQMAEYNAYLEWRASVESVGEGWMGGMGGGSSGSSRTSGLQGPGAFGISVGPGFNSSAPASQYPGGFDAGMDGENYMTIKVGTPPAAAPNIELPTLTMDGILNDVLGGGDLGMALGGLGLITAQPPLVWSDGSITGGDTSAGSAFMGPPSELAGGPSAGVGDEGYDDGSARIGATDLPSFDAGVTAPEQKSIRDEFNSAFKEAREAGQSTFMFDAGDGAKPYTTGTREDVAASLRGGSKSAYQNFITENFKGKDSDAGLAAYVDSLKPKAATPPSSTPLFGGEVPSFDNTSFNDVLAGTPNTAQVLSPDSALGKMVQNSIEYGNYVTAEKAKAAPDTWSTIKNVALNGAKLLDEVNQVRSGQIGSDGMNALGKIAEDFFSAIGSGAKAIGHARAHPAVG